MIGSNEDPKARSWELRFVGEKAWSLNRERKWHGAHLTRVSRRWRSVFAVLATEAAIPRLQSVAIRSWPLAQDHKHLMDVSNCMPATKSAIDGLVLAGVLEDDCPGIVRSVTFLPTEIGPRDGLVLVLDELDA